MKSELEDMLDYTEIVNSVTSKIKKHLALLVRELAVVEKLARADENAERATENALKAWHTAEALDAEVKRVKEILKRGVGQLKEL